MIHLHSSPLHNNSAGPSEKEALPWHSIFSTFLLLKQFHTWRFCKTGAGYPAQVLYGSPSSETTVSKCPLNIFAQKSGPKARTELILVPWDGSEMLVFHAAPRARSKSLCGPLERSKSPVQVETLPVGASSQRRRGPWHMHMVRGTSPSHMVSGQALSGRRKGGDGTDPLPTWLFSRFLDSCLCVPGLRGRYEGGPAAKPDLVTRENGFEPQSPIGDHTAAFSMLRWTTDCPIHRSDHVAEFLVAAVQVPIVYGPYGEHAAHESDSRAPSLTLSRDSVSWDTAGGGERGAAKPDRRRGLYAHARRRSQVGRVHPAHMPSARPPSPLLLVNSIDLALRMGQALRAEGRCR
jgi:hypothetical protein